MTEKEQLRESLLTILQSQRETALIAADNAHDAATHEQSVAETQYDTIGLEAAYLAHGQSQRVAEYDATISRIRSLALRDFDIEDDIDLGALVNLSDGLTYWFLPVCGGMKLISDSVQVLVVTPHSPLGEMLDGAELEEILEDGREVIGIR
ncbi:hypothetical protein [Vibrio hannami]|uniref:hypothetical protein n=1 Tax=Vibrio hannami TaxID=2717094 RepID=UPI003EB9A15B